MAIAAQGASAGRTAGRAGGARNWWTLRRRRALFLFVLLAPSLIIFLLYRLIPLGWNIVLSFEHWSLAKPARFAGLYHYEEMFLYDDVFWEALRNTLYFMLSAVAGIVLAIGLAVLVNARIRGRNVYRTIIFMSYPLMVVAVGIIWRWIYDEKTGLINYALRSVGLIDQPIAFLESFSTALLAIMVAAVWQIIGLYMIIIITGMKSIPGHLYEAASIDGANRWQQFYRITLPLLRPSIFLCLMIGIIMSFTSFDLVFVMTNGGPGHATELLITYIYKTAFNVSKLDYAAALTVFTFFMFLILALVINRFSGGEAGQVEISE